MKRPDKDEQRPQEEQELEEEVDESELGAVSQHSLRAAGYDQPHEAAMDAGYAEEQEEGDEPHETPMGMARRQLEEATEAPVHPGPMREEERDAIPPAEEAAMRVEQPSSAD